MKTYALPDEHGDTYACLLKDGSIRILKYDIFDDDWENIYSKTPIFATDIRSWMPLDPVVKFIEENSILLPHMETEAEKSRRNFHKELEKLGLTERMIDDVMVAALEGGSNHWYYVDNLQLSKLVGYKRNDNIHYSFLDGVYQGGEVPIYDANEYTVEATLSNDPDERLKPLGYLNSIFMIRALETMFSKHFERYARIRTGQFDAEDADVFFQLAVMNEIVYG